MGTVCSQPAVKEQDNKRTSRHDEIYIKHVEALINSYKEPIQGVKRQPHANYIPTASNTAYTTCTVGNLASAISLFKVSNSAVDQPSRSHSKLGLGQTKSAANPRLTRNTTRRGSFLVINSSSSFMNNSALDPTESTLHVSIASVDSILKGDVPVGLDKNAMVAALSNENKRRANSVFQSLGRH